MEYTALLATDDKQLREEARKNKIAVIGSIGLLKLLSIKKIIPTPKEYLQLIEKIQADVYLSEDLIEWNGQKGFDTRIDY